MKCNKCNNEATEIYFWGRDKEDWEHLCKKCYKKVDKNVKRQISNFVNGTVKKWLYEN